MKAISLLLLLFSAFTFSCYAASTANALESSMTNMVESWSNYNDMLTMALKSPSSSNDEQLTTAADRLNDAFDRAIQDTTATNVNAMSTLQAASTLISITHKLTNVIANTSSIIKASARDAKLLQFLLRHNIAHQLNMLQRDVITLQKKLEVLHPATEAGKVAQHALMSLAQSVEVVLMDAERVLRV